MKQPILTLFVLSTVFSASSCLDPGQDADEDVVDIASGACATDLDCATGRVCTAEGSCEEVSCQYCTGDQICYRESESDPGSCSALECSRQLDCPGGQCCGGVCQNAYVTCDAPDPDPTMPNGEPMLAAPILDVGRNGVCATNLDGVLYCWGVNFLGALGRGSLGGTAGGTATPNDLATLPPMNLTQVEVGHYHGCALSSAGQLLCWGESTFGQTLRDDVVTCASESTTKCSAVPSPITFERGTVIDVAAAGDTTCIRTADAPERLKCWGQGYSCDLERVLDGRSCPTQPSPRSFDLPPEGIKALESSAQAVCWVSESGAVTCHVQSGTLRPSILPPGEHEVLTSGAVDITVHSQFFCVLMEDGGIQCGGQDHRGVLGIEPSDTDTLHPLTPIAEIDDAVAIAGTCAVRADGTVWCWGNNRNSQLGVDSSAEVVLTPMQVRGLADVVDLRGVGDYKCARERDANNVKCWGTWDPTGRMATADWNGTRTEPPGEETELSRSPIYSPEAEEVGAQNIDVVVVNHRDDCPNYSVYVGPGGTDGPRYSVLAGYFSAAGDPGPGCAQLSEGGSVVRAQLQIESETWIHAVPSDNCNPPVIGVASGGSPGTCLRIDLY